MRLSELQPEWEKDNSYLVFLCPKCPRVEGGRYSQCVIMIPIHPTGDAELGSARGWDWNGESDFEKVTINPSIWHHCESDPHFFITDGEIKMC